MQLIHTIEDHRRCRKSIIDDLPEIRNRISTSPEILTHNAISLSLNQDSPDEVKRIGMPEQATCVPIAHIITPEYENLFRQ